MNPRKMVPVFMLLAAFFMTALWVGLTYTQTKQSRIPRGSAHVVSIKDSKADPNTLIIKTGEIVQFTSADGKAHKLGQGDAEEVLHDANHKVQHDEALQGVQSDEFTDNFRYTFSKAGIYYLHDHLDPKLVIEVQVFDPE